MERKKGNYEVNMAPKTNTPQQKKRVAVRPPQYAILRRQREKSQTANTHSVTTKGGNRM